MRTALIVPVDGRGADWPRRVANAIKHLLGIEDTVTAIDTRLSTAEGTITSHGTRLTTAEGTIVTQGGEIDALQALVRAGAGTPEGAVAAPVGTLFLRSDGGGATVLYIKESGTGNTGWVAK